jgi:hypothetical protein
MAIRFARLLGSLTGWRYDLTVLDRGAQSASGVRGVSLLRSIGRILLADADPDQRLRACFQKAWEILSALSATALLEELAELLQLAPIISDALKACVVTADHLGFLLPPRTDPQRVARIAAETHFPNDHRCFQSTVLARELGALVGREQVPTTIFKASGHSRGGQSISLEGFIPTLAPGDGVARAWIATGLGSHIGFRTRSRAALHEVQQILEAAGVDMPAFMNGRPLENPAERILLFYVDIKMDQEQPLRCEFYHQEPGG